MAQGFDILVNGVQRTYRDRKDAAHAAAIYLKERGKTDIVEMRNTATGVITTIMPDGRLG
jgi:hypothetical protein